MSLASSEVVVMVLWGSGAGSLTAFRLWEEAPVIHPVARGGPECRAVLGGSIKWAAVLC